jgi:hypothetical protein
MWFVANALSPAQSVLGSSHWEDPGVVEQPDNRTIKSDDLCSRAPNTPKVRQVAHDAHSATALLFESLLQLAELFTIAPDEDDGAVLGYLECGRATNAGGWAR